MIRSAISLSAILLLFAGCTKSDDTSTQATETKAGPQGELLLSAVALTRDYGSDAAAFDKKYSGKLVIIDGIVAFDSMQDAKWGELLPLRGDGDVLVRCVRTGNFADQALGIGAGRKVKVRGRVNPFQKGRKDVVLTECDLLEK